LAPCLRLGKPAGRGLDRSSLAPGQGPEGAGAAVVMPGLRAFAVEPGVPFCAQTVALRRMYSPAAYDWLELAVVRDGTGRVFHRDKPPELVKPWSVVFLMPNVPCAIDPEGQVTLSRLFFAVDFMLDQVRWECLPVAPDREAARVAARYLFPEPSQVVRVEDADAQRVLGASLDALAGMTKAGAIRSSYYEALSAATAPLGVVAPQLRRSGHRIWGSKGGLARKPTMPSMASIRAIRPEINKAREWIVKHAAERFTVASVARLACLSPQQFDRAFRAQVGKAPMKFRDAVRVHNMVYLLIETSLSIGDVARRVGWTKTSHAIRVFRTAVGMTPATYRERFGAHLEAHRYPDPLASYPDPLVFKQ
jgi:AraC-like DNA-binding protein